MELENSFEVGAPRDRVWDFLLDLERVTPCIPGAELDELPDERTWKGKVTVKLGAVSLSYAATAVIEQRDEESGRVVIEAQGRETRGKGRASATINSTLEETGEGTKVEMHTDLKISGPAARYGRGMMEDVSKRLTGQFADCLKATIETGEEGSEAAAKPASAPAPAPVAKPVGGIRLAAWAIGRAILRAMGRIVAAIRARFSGG
ncbi:MAG TPA: SRPBCC family protein [Solirubrobacterales bacterium]